MISTNYRQSGFLLMLLGLIVLIGACNLYPDSDTRLEDLDIVLTSFNEEAKFGTLKTFAMRDTVFPTSSDTTKEPEYLDKDLNDFILNTIRLNMESLGYQEVAKDANPDLAINAGFIVITNANVSYYCNPNYWYGGGYGWGYPGYGWGYPGYGYGWCPTYTSVTVYNVGTLMVDLVNLTEVNASTEQLQLMWQAAVRGVLSSSTSQTKNRVKAGIDQAFAQSSYLRITQ